MTRAPDGAEPFLDAMVAENSRRRETCRCSLTRRRRWRQRRGRLGADGRRRAADEQHARARETANQLSLLLDDDDDDDDDGQRRAGATKVRAISKELAELCVSPSRGHAAEVCREVTGANVNVMPSPGRAPAC